MKFDQYPSFEKAKKVEENGIFLEIGTWDGDFSYKLLKDTCAKKVYCVDPYQHFVNNEYPDAMNNLTQEHFDNKYEYVRKRFEEFGNRVEFIRKTSDEASLLFDDNTFHFVYIDGNHDYQYVHRDILNWYPKVQKNGYLCGDDVISYDLSEHDQEKNAIRYWSSDKSSWGKYGTFPACLDAEKELHIKFIFEGTQFSCLK